MTIRFKSHRIVQLPAGAPGGPVSAYCRPGLSPAGEAPAPERGQLWHSSSSSPVTVDYLAGLDISPVRLHVPPRPQRFRTAGDQGVCGRVPKGAVLAN